MIRISNGDEFRLLIEGLAEDIQHAHIHWRLYKDLQDAHRAHPLVMHQSLTFWHLTHRAHVFEAIQCLARAFDQSDRALHLRGWLETIQTNLNLFSVEEFKQRLAGNAFVDSLAASLRAPDPVQLSLDLDLCSADDPKVKALVLQRNNVTAHRSARMAAKGRSASEEFGLPVSDFEELLDRSLTILNRYSTLFAATSYSTTMVGHRDYEYIFQCVTEAVERSRKASQDLRWSVTQGDREPE